jgi:zinc/manganese transport system substrate-binding protein
MRHVYQPEYARDRTYRLRRADVIFTNGLGFEGWLSRLMSATNAKGSSFRWVRLSKRND